MSTILSTKLNLTYIKRQGKKLLLEVRSGDPNRPFPSRAEPTTSAQEYPEIQQDRIRSTRCTPGHRPLIRLFQLGET